MVSSIKNRVMHAVIRFFQISVVLCSWLGYEHTYTEELVAGHRAVLAWVRTTLTDTQKQLFSAKHSALRIQNSE